jgi:toxin secretion/phage lysis holin
MEVKSVDFKVILALCGTFASFLIGDWHISLTILLVFMSIDMITGLIKGAMNGGLRSAIGFKGMARKATILLVIIIANMLDILVGGGVPVFRTMAVFFYVGNEGLSILENLGQIGVPVPKGIAKYIQQLKDNNDDKDNNTDIK